MSRASVHRILSLIPERVARSQSGLPFVPGESSCCFPERLSYLAGHLQWLSPLQPIGNDERRLLGFGAAQARPAETTAATGAAVDTERAEEEEQTEGELDELDLELEIEPTEEDEGAIDAIV